MNIDKFIETLSPEQIESLKSALLKTQQKEELVEDNNNNFRMNKSENSISETKAERNRVAATIEMAQPKPNTSAAPTALQPSCSTLKTDLQPCYQLIDHQ
jgi:hypothetical protein